MDAISHGAVFARRYLVLTAILIGGAVLALGVFGSAQSANAQQGFGNVFGYETSQRPRKRVIRRRTRSPDADTAESKKSKKKEKEAAEEQAPVGAVYAVVSLGDQHISVYDSTGRIARSRVSTGTAGHPTPRGVFAIIGKERWHHSNIYSGAPMPWMQRITWSGVAMHAGVVPGYPASHGCIRLPYSFAPQMWKLTKMNQRVVVAPRDTEPFAIAHSFLPVPNMHPAPTTTASRQAANGASEPVQLASISPAAGAGMTTATATDGQSADVAKPLNPIAFAEALKERAKADKTVADKAAKDALDVAQAAGAEARQAVDDLRKAEADMKAAEARLAELDAAPAKPVETSDPAKAQEDAEASASARTAAQSELSRARAALEEAQRRETAKTPTAFAAVQTWKDAVAASETAAETLKEAHRRTEPVSVLVSKKEGRIFIRQDWKEVYEAPVTFRDPDRPIGTHVYIAVANEPDGSALRWSAITVPESSPRREARKSSKRKSEEEPVEKSVPAETAAGALDRIELPPGVRERIADLLWTGASLIVSDHARSYEMGDYTDFIVLTR